MSARKAFLSVAVIKHFVIFQKTISSTQQAATLISRCHLYWVLKSQGELCHCWEVTLNLTGNSSQQFKIKNQAIENSPIRYTSWSHTYNTESPTLKKKKKLNKTLTSEAFIPGLNSAHWKYFFLVLIQWDINWPYGLVSCLARLLHLCFGRSWTGDPLLPIRLLPAIRTAA